MPGLNSRVGWLSAMPAPESQQDDAAPREGEGTQSSCSHEIPGGPPLARIVLLAVVCSFVAVEAIELWTPSLGVPASAPKAGVSIASLIVLSALTAWVTSAAAERWPPWRRLAMLLAEGLITYLPLVVIGTAWTGMAGFFAGSALLLLSGWAAWAVFTGAIAGLLLGVVAVNLNAYEVAYLTLLNVVLGLVVFGLARLSVIIGYVQAKRGELAQLAVISERMRFARDLHDLLGYSLSAITLKAELARRLVGSNPGRSRDELAEAIDIARQALADVRIVARGYRNISLAKEAGSVMSVLAAAGIEAQVGITCGALDERVDTVLATVLREAVTNMLRHSTARHCIIEAGICGQAVRLLVANDGVPRSAASARKGGGLENLATRAAAIGGHLTARARGDGWFDVLAEVPLASTAADECAAAGADADSGSEGTAQ